MLTYGGVQLSVGDAAVRDWISGNIPLSETVEFASLYWPGPGMLRVAFPGVVPARKIRVGSLWWPRTASKFAVAHFLASDAQLALIRDQVYQSQSLSQPAYRAVPLVMSWDDAAAGAEVARITTDLWLLPPRPLAQIPGWNGYSLLTLVDDRYWWWFKSTGALAVTEGTTTWANLYSSLGTSLDASLSHDDIDGDYLKPAHYLERQYEHAPLLLDAVAYNVGQRIVRGLDGAVRACDPETGADDVAANLALGAARSKLAGGRFLFSQADQFRDAPPVLPKSVVTTFPRTTGGVPYAIEVRLSDLALDDLPTSLATHPGKKTFHDTAAAVGDGTPTNDAELQSLAERIATDFYRFAVAAQSVKFDGVVPWRPEAMNDWVEWTYHGADGPEGEGEVTTRVERPPWNDLTEELSHAGAGAPTSDTDDTASDGSMLVQLTAKCYYDGSGTRDLSGCPTSDGINCPPADDCCRRFILYSWVRVYDTTDPCAIAYVDGGQAGSFDCFPVIHEQNIDLPVFPAGGTLGGFFRTAADSGAAGTVAWSDVSDALASDDVWATATLAAGEETHYLLLTGTCFGVGGNDATVGTIIVSVEAHADGDLVKDVEVKLVVGGVPVGASQHTGVDLPTADAVRTYSHNSTVWTGAGALTAADINGMSFGVALRYKNNAASARKVFVDYAEIVVTYTPAGTAGGAPHSVVRVRRGRGDYWLIDQLPWIDLFRRTDDTDADGIIGFHRYFDPNDNAWKDGQEVRIVLAE